MCIETVVRPGRAAGRGSSYSPVRLGRALVAGAGLLLLPGLAMAQNMPPQKSGFPLTIAGQGAPSSSQVLPADLGLTPGFKSLVYGLPNGKLYVIQRNSPSSWGVAPGWPQTLPSPIYSSPAVGNLDADAEPEIVVGFGYFSPSFSVGGVRAFNRNGTVLWTASIGDIQPGPGDGISDPVVSTPAIGDIDGDGTAEVVFGGLDHHLHVRNGENGLTNNAAFWPKDLGDTVFSSPMLHDLDGDGRLDIITGSDRFQINGGRLWVLRFDGTNLPGFPKDIPNQVVSSSPAIGDIDGDGQPEIVHGTGNFTPFAGSQLVYAWNCDGSAVSGWPVTVSGQVFTSPALANLDGDVPLEVVVTSNNTEGSSVFRVYGFNGNGSQIFSTIVRDFFGQSLSAFDPVVGDVMGADSAPEILVPTNGEVAVFTASGAPLTDTNNFTGDPNDEPSLMTQASLGAVAVTDLETNFADSKIEVIAVSGQGSDTAIHVWNPITRTSSPPWGFFHQNEPRRGVAPATPSCSTPAACIPNSAAANFFTLTPCRLVDTRNPNGPLAGPALSSNVPRTFTLNTCGIPPNAKAISVNLTALQASGAATVRFATGTCPSVPNWTTVFVPAGQIRSSNAMLALDSNRAIVTQASVAGGGTVHLIIDVNGYFQ